MGSTKPKSSGDDKSNFVSVNESVNAESLIGGSNNKQGGDVIINFSAYDQYVYCIMQNMVDDVCLYYARQDQVKQKYMG
jgi:hypothetical protein